VVEEEEEEEEEEEVVVVVKVKAVDDLGGRAARALSAAAQEVEPGTAREQPAAPSSSRCCRLR
jgi:hypothetical protein